MTLNPKTTTNKIKTQKTQFFHKLPRMLYEKMKKWKKGKKKKGPYHTRNNPNNNMEKKNEFPFAQGRQKKKRLDGPRIK